MQRTSKSGQSRDARQRVDSVLPVLTVQEPDLRAECGLGLGGGSMTWAKRLSKWFAADRDREWVIIHPGDETLVLRPSGLKKVTALQLVCRLGGVKYLLSNGLVIFAETLSQSNL